PGDAATGSTGHGLAKLPPAPVTSPPDPQYLPDLVALPAFRMFAYHRGTKDFLGFGATEWVGGGSNLDVQGFRRHNANTMDAYQYFFRDGEVVGRARVGTLEFDTRPGHDHWHFEQFARYSLLDHTQSLIVRSHKQSFCIAPTDAIDLTLPGSVARPDVFGFFGNCGSSTSVWVHEQMPLGWGDTYLQNVAGQAFNITDLPNGTYYVSVQVNPTGLLFEQTTSNDTALRKVILSGTPGHRRICVPAINGVDQEGGC
ncbi:MAG TPA: lysyl oxidase family protein, partial [Actinomycetota bacterium]|nr:lysyl oxidase family protein [Actinomycetota bacterium]